MADWVCGSFGGGWVDSTAPPRYTSAQTLAPNKPLLRRLGLQVTSFTQDGSSHTEMYSLQFSIVKGSGDASSIFLQSMVLTEKYISDDLQPMREQDTGQLDAQGGLFLHTFWH